MRDAPSPVDVAVGKSIAMLETSEAVKAAATDSGAGDELLKRIKIMGWPNVNLGRETNDPCWLLEKKLGGAMKLDRRRGYYGGPGSCFLLLWFLRLFEGFLSWGSIV